MQPPGSGNARPEHPSTYFVEDRSNEEELTRLRIQDELITTGMGGVLPDQADPTAFGRVLDVGCGTGNWLIETAKRYRAIRQLIGVDVSGRMVDYARAQAEAQQVSDRVEFHVMDALRLLEFPTNYFDLVNQRAGASYLRTWDWPRLLHEYQRVTHAGGIIRVTEFDLIPQSSSPALTQLCELLAQALYRAGHLFVEQSSGVTSELERLLSQHGLLDVQSMVHTLSYTSSSTGLFEDVRIGFRTFVPFLRKWIRVPEHYEEIYQQALREMRHPDFIGTGRLLTAWGRKE